MPLKLFFLSVLLAFVTLVCLDLSIGETYRANEQVVCKEGESTANISYTKVSSQEIVIHYLSDIRVFTRVKGKSFLLLISLIYFASMVAYFSGKKVNERAA